jgi:hypothetical protein
MPPTPPVETGLGNKARRPAIESLPYTCINNFFSESDSSENFILNPQNFSSKIQKVYSMERSL